MTESRTHLGMFRQILDDSKMDHRIEYHPTESFDQYTTEIIIRQGDQDVIIDFNNDGELIVMGAEEVVEPLPARDE